MGSTDLNSIDDSACLRQLAQVMISQTRRTESHSRCPLSQNSIPVSHNLQRQRSTHANRGWQFSLEIHMQLKYECGKFKIADKDVVPKGLSVFPICSSNTTQYIPATCPQVMRSQRA